VLKLDTCLYSKVSSERTEILSGHFTERDSEAQRSVDPAAEPDAQSVTRAKGADSIRQHVVPQVTALWQALYPAELGYRSPIQKAAASPRPR
jgi:hypothetical protein